MTEPARHEILVGLHVTDHETYASYRAAMSPLLAEVGGFFRYDFTIDQVLKGAGDPPINRLFVISFPDEATKNAMFADPAYVAVKKQFFEQSVAATNILATYDRAEG